jgi:hypothetical protein
MVPRVQLYLYQHLHVVEYLEREELCNLQHGLWFGLRSNLFVDDIQKDHGRRWGRERWTTAQGPQNFGAPKSYTRMHRHGSE